MWALLGKDICEILMAESTEPQTDLSQAGLQADGAIDDTQAQIAKTVEKQISHLGAALEDGLLTCRASDGVIIQANRGANRLIEDRLVGHDLSAVLGFPDALSLIHAASDSNITQEFTHNFKGTVDRQFRIRLKRLDADRVAVVLMDMTLQRNLDKVRLCCKC